MLAGDNEGRNERRTGLDFGIGPAVGFGDAGLLVGDVPLVDVDAGPAGSGIQDDGVWSSTLVGIFLWAKDYRRKLGVKGNDRYHFQNRYQRNKNQRPTFCSCHHRDRLGQRG